MNPGSCKGALLTLVVLAVVLSAGSLTTPHLGSAEVAAIAKEFATSHTYILGTYDCDDMSITLANEYRIRGYNVTLMIGNPLVDVNGDLYQINHAWVMVQVNGTWLAVESETGQIPLADSRYYGDIYLVGNFTGEDTFLNYLYYRGWPVQVDDYWAWLNLYKSYRVSGKERYYPMPAGMPA